MDTPSSKAAQRHNPPRACCQSVTSYAEIDTEEFPEAPSETTSGPCAANENPVGPSKTGSDPCNTDESDEDCECGLECECKCNISVVDEDESGRPDDDYSIDGDEDSVYDSEISDTSSCGPLSVESLEIAAQYQKSPVKLDLSKTKPRKSKA
ncbi:hypothetical protein G6011_06815 [Alternaria panax]|uniref:Uncharacterized protein n=1 Tax=Alternaria panax TaxID=48097 RepID=A0AAD4FHJ3_9PLEO|nr:hypothetical protein G6011_06815 [Alternaria panax]